MHKGAIESVQIRKLASIIDKILQANCVYAFSTYKNKIENTSQNNQCSVTAATCIYAYAHGGSVYQQSSDCLG